MDRTKKPGRPSHIDSDDKREKLVQTAAQLFGAKGYDSVSLKEISSEADVTPAMVSYYFKGGKSGLLKAVIELAISMLLKNSQKIIEESEASNFADSYARNHLHFMAEHSWIVPLITREVLSKDSESRHMFLKDLGPKALSMMSPRVHQEMDSKILRADMNPDFLQISLIGMTVFPFLAAPLLSPLFGYKPDKEFAQNYAEHVHDLFMQGAKTRKK